MTTLIDCTTSIYKLFNDFINTLKLDADLPDFEFSATTSLEAAYLTLSSSTSKIVVVQKSQAPEKQFTKLVYTLVPSFSGTGDAVDYNSILTMKVISAFLATYKKYTPVPIYSAEGLMSSPSTFTALPTKMVISDLRQEIVGATQLRNNFNALEITFLGYIG